MWGGLTPAYNPDRCPDKLPFGPWTLEQLRHPKEIIQQIISNLLAPLDFGLFSATEASDESFDDDIGQKAEDL